MKNIIPAANESTLDIQTLERCLADKLDRDLGNIVETVLSIIQNVLSNAIDIIITPKFELAVELLIRSSERHAVSFIANSTRAEHIDVTASFEIASKRNNRFHEVKATNETSSRGVSRPVGGGG